MLSKFWRIMGGGKLSSLEGTGTLPSQEPSVRLWEQETKEDMDERMENMYWHGNVLFYSWGGGGGGLIHFPPPTN